MTQVLEAALAYRRLGWSVIPVGQNTKKPLVAWAEFQTRLPSEQEIQAWWREYPMANVALVTGRLSGIVVVDTDPKRGGDAKAINESNPAKMIVQTGSGGHHLYYRHPGNGQRIVNQVGKTTGIDVRGDGGYVVLPPSKHISGRRYEWKRGSETTVLSNPPDFVINPHSNGQGAKAGEPWLTEALKGVSAGNRNDLCTRLAGYFCGKGMPKDVVLEQMLAWNSRNTPPLGRKEVETTVESVFRTASRREAAPNHTIRREVSEPFALVSLTDYMVQYGDVDIAWMVEDWLPDHTIAMMVAPPGTFKTWTELDLAVAVASGTKFLGHFKVARRGPVLIMQQEDFHGQIAQRLGVIIASRFGIEEPTEKDGIFSFTVPPDLPIYIHPDRQFRFSDKTVLEALQQKIAQIRPALVILDPLYSAGGVDDYMAATVQEMFFFKNLRDEYGCSFLIAHHTKKKSEGSDREDAWGSQFLNAFVETGWQIRPTDTVGVATIRRHFKVRQNIEEMQIKFDISTVGNKWNYSVELSEMKPKAATKYAPEMNFTAVLIERGPMTMTQLAEEFKVDRSTVSRRAGKLIELGQLVKLSDGRVDVSNSGRT